MTNATTTRKLTFQNEKEFVRHESNEPQAVALPESSISVQHYPLHECCLLPVAFQTPADAFHLQIVVIYSKTNKTILY